MQEGGCGETLYGRYLNISFKDYEWTLNRLTNLLNMLCNIIVYFVIVYLLLIV